MEGGWRGNILWLWKSLVRLGVVKGWQPPPPGIRFTSLVHPRNSGQLSVNFRPLIADLISSSAKNSAKDTWKSVPPNSVILHWHHIMSTSVGYGELWKRKRGGCRSESFLVPNPSSIQQEHIYRKVKCRWAISHGCNWFGWVKGHPTHNIHFINHTLRT